MGASLFPPTPAEAARWMFDPYDPDRRREGMVLISNSTFGGDEVYLRAYRDMVQNDPDPGVRAVAIRALAKWGTGPDAKLIAVHLADPSRIVRWEAAMGLQRLHDPAVVPDLLKTLDNDTEDVDVRAAAATALAQYPEDRVFQGLIAALDAPELSVNLAAEQSLKTLTEHEFGLDPDPWLAWYRTQQAPFADPNEFRYPTYTREENFFEMLAFWSKKQWETPAPPAGSQSQGPRSTYGTNEGNATEQATP